MTKPPRSGADARRICVVCGGPFTAPTRRGIVCSEPCRKERRDQRNRAYWIKHREKLLARRDNPEYREKDAARARARRTDPECREKQRAKARARYWEDPEKHRAEARARYRDDPKVRARQRARKSTTAYREKASAQKSARYRDNPTYREKDRARERAPLVVYDAMLMAGVLRDSDLDLPPSTTKKQRARAAYRIAKDLANSDDPQASAFKAMLDSLKPAAPIKRKRQRVAV
jgi:predicted nucleic acid-binding Zn ribbon protein